MPQKKKMCKKRWWLFRRDKKRERQSFRAAGWRERVEREERERRGMMKAYKTSHREGRRERGERRLKSRDRGEMMMMKDGPTL